jgi:hypothetical protein
MTNVEPASPAATRFRALVRERRAVLPRKDRADFREVYFTCSLKHLLQQISHEMNAGIRHNSDDVAALILLSNEHAATKKLPARKRFRGLGQ